MAEPKERGPVLFAQALEPSRACEDRREAEVVLKDVPDILWHLRAGHARVYPFLQLVEFVQHQENSTWARSFKGSG